MSGLSSLRRSVIAGLLATCVSATAFAQIAPGTGGTTPPAAAATTAAPPLATAASAPAQPPFDMNGPVAIINGKTPIDARNYMEILEQVDNLKTFFTVMNLALAQDACHAAGIKLDDASFSKRMDAELEHAMDDYNIAKTEDGKPDGKALTKEGRVNILNYVLQQQGRSPIEFRIWWETQTELRALSERNVSVEPQELKDTYDAEYGPKRRIHIMTWPDNVKVSDIKSALATKQPNGKPMSPELVAAMMGLPNPAAWTISENAKEGPNKDKIKKIYDMAFVTLKTPGEVSPETDVEGQDGKTQKIIIILDEIVKDARGDNPIDKVKADIEARILYGKQNQWMARHMQELLVQAPIEFKDPLLKRQFTDRIAAIVAAQQAATRSATAPASMPAIPPATAPASTTSRPAAPAPGR